MGDESFFSEIIKHKTLDLPFVLYKKPNSDTIIALLQKNDSLYNVVDYQEKGFVFASFDKKQIVLIPENESEICISKLNRKSVSLVDTVDLNFEPEDKKQFETLVEKGVKAIAANEFKKVVLSRCEIVPLKDFDFIETFQNLANLYPTTLVYCFFHPKVGFWMGATPEQLLKVQGNIFETTALAGTQKATSATDIIWHQKEKDEQQYVTDFIVKKLENIASSVEVSAPYSANAGSIWHIKTDISGILNTNSGLEEVIDLLHPTPAVCGYPKKKSRAFILENENYNRTFYTGFLGELNNSPDAISFDLFVNLRSMQIFDNEAFLYMGCGITKESIPEKEWEESVNKSMTMKRVLNIKPKLCNRTQIKQICCRKATD